MRSVILKKAWEIIILGLLPQFLLEDKSDRLFPSVSTLATVPYPFLLFDGGF